MTVFIELNNGTIRRVRGTFGGSQAWKQHADDNTEWGLPSSRRRLLDQEEARLAAEQMRDALAFNGGSLSDLCRVDREPVRRNRNRNRNGSCHSVPSSLQPMVAAMTMTTVTVKKAAPARRPFKVVKSESGKLVCVFLD